MSANTVTKRLSLSAPRLGLCCLLVCLISGAVLSFYYRPTGDVFRSVEEITTKVPYGKFFRQAHYGSGQAFVILMLLHTVDYFLRKRYRLYSPSLWALLIISLLLCFLALLTGFIMKGDKEGLFAGTIMLNILKGVPLAGDKLARVFITTPEKDFFFLPYLYHCLFLPVALIFSIKNHIRQWRPDSQFLAVTTSVIIIFALVVEPGSAIPPEATVNSVEGPWFMLGIQTLLKWLPPLWGGFLIPLLFFGCVIVLPLTGGRWQNILHYGVIGVFCMYSLLVLRAALAGP